MFDRELKRQIRTSLSSIDGHLAVQNELMGRINEEMQLTREEVRLSREERADLRSFIREMTARIERGTRAQESALADLSDQVRANTQAVLAALDRLSPPPADA